MENTNQHRSSRKDSNKVFLLVAVILVLLGTNAYLFFKEKSVSERVITITDEKSSMQLEIDKIEAELDQATSTNIKITKDMQESEELARQKIADLREQLKKGQITQSELNAAQEEIKQLRYFVTKYAVDIEDLKSRNALLTVERDSLKTTVTTVSARASELENQNVGLSTTNAELNSKVKIASAIKAGSITLTPLRVRNSGKETDVIRANTTKKLRVSFNVVDNEIAEKGMHDIYLRVMDPNGNLITSNNNTFFEADDEQLQYTYKTAIEFSNDGKLYAIDWTNPGNFQKGTYTVVLYADGHVMGQKTLALR
jgi:prepilin-type processing-associated H-X9-DG protein